MVRLVLALLLAIAFALACEVPPDEADGSGDDVQPDPCVRPDPLNPFFLSLTQQGVDPSLTAIRVSGDAWVTYAGAAQAETDLYEREIGLQFISDAREVTLRYVLPRHLSIPLAVGESVRAAVVRDARVVGDWDLVTIRGAAHDLRGFLCRGTGCTGQAGDCPDGLGCPRLAPLDVACAPVEAACGRTSWPPVRVEVVAGGATVDLGPGVQAQVSDGASAWRFLVAYVERLEPWADERACADPVALRVAAGIVRE